MFSVFTSPTFYYLTEQNLNQPYYKNIMSFENIPGKGQNVFLPYER